MWQPSRTSINKVNDVNQTVISFAIELTNEAPLLVVFSEACSRYNSNYQIMSVIKAVIFDSPAHWPSAKAANNIATYIRTMSSLFNSSNVTELQEKRLIKNEVTGSYQMLSKIVCLTHCSSGECSSEASNDFVLFLYIN